MSGRWRSGRWIVRMWCRTGIVIASSRDGPALVCCLNNAHGAGACVWSDVQGRIFPFVRPSVFYIFLKFLFRLLHFPPLANLQAIPWSRIVKLRLCYVSETHATRRVVRLDTIALFSSQSFSSVTLSFLVLCSSWVCFAMASSARSF